MDNYIFQYKKSGSWFWKKATVVGHNYFSETDKMALYYSNGIEEIANWSAYNCKLGSDFMLVQKKNLEKKAGTSVVLNANV
jgi:hypothetical protein